MPQHGVDLVQLRDARPKRLHRDAGGLRHARDLGVRARQELVQRRVEQADRHRQPRHDAEERGEIAALRRQQLGERGAAAVRIRRHDHLAHGDDAGVVEEHVLGAAKADPLGAEAERRLGVRRRLGVGADAQATRAIRPAHEGREIVGERRLDGGHRAFQQLAARAVDGDRIPGGDHHPARPALARRLVDAERACPGDAGPPHAAGDDGGVARHAAPAGDDPPGRVHAVDVLRAGLGAEQDHGLAAIGAVFRLVGVEDDLAAGRARRCRQAPRQHPARRLGIEGRVQQLLERERVHPHQRLRLAHQACACHVNGDLQRRLGGALAGACLQDPEGAALHRELDVLHVAVVAFEPAHHHLERGEGVRHRALHGGRVGAARLAPGLAHGARRADAGDHVLALRVDQVLAVEHGLAGGRVARKRDAGGAVVPHVAEDHGLHGDRRAPLGRDAVQPAVGDGAGVHP